VTRYDSLRLLTALPALYNLDTAQLDVKSAFTYGPLDEEIWVSPPPGLRLDNKVLLLKKALYGLKQAPLQWYRKLCSVLIKLYFIPIYFNPYVFISTESNILIAIYIDDIVLVCKTSELNKLIEFLQTYFIVTVKGTLLFIVGIEIQYHTDAITLRQ